MPTVEPDGWIIMRSRVSLAGRVMGAGGGIASGGVLSLTVAKEADRRNATSSSHDSRRRYDTRIRSDGFYFFLDLPAGDYVLDGQDEGGNEIEAKPVSIPPPDGSGPLHVVGVDLTASTRSGADEPAEAKAPAESAQRRRARRAR
jgi:hypothetical protein